MIRPLHILLLLTNHFLGVCDVSFSLFLIDNSKVAAIPLY